MASPQPLPATRAADAEIRRLLDYPLRDLEYLPGPMAEFPWWHLDREDRRSIISASTNSKAKDPYTGGGFRLELEEGSTQRGPNAKLTGRALFFQLLGKSELEAVLKLQNRIISSLPAPLPSHIERYPPVVRQQYFSYFEPQEDFDAIRCWLRYRTLADVESWCQLLEPILRPLLYRARSTLKADEMYLGRGAILLA